MKLHCITKLNDSQTQLNEIQMNMEDAMGNNMRYLDKKKILEIKSLG